MGERGGLVQRGLTSVTVKEGHTEVNGRKLQKSQQSRAIQTQDRLVCKVVSSPPLEVSKYLFIHLLCQYICLKVQQ